MNTENMDIPHHLKGGLQRYVEEGIEPGSFLQAILKNDLVGAATSADHTNRDIIADIVMELYNSEEMPGHCWGSKEAYNKHVISFTESGKTMDISKKILDFIDANFDDLMSYPQDELVLVIGTMSAKGSFFEHHKCEKFASSVGYLKVQTVDLIGISIRHPKKTWEIV